MPESNPSVEFDAARRLLSAGCQSLQVSLSADQTESFLSYLSLMLLWSRTFNLTAIRDPLAIVRLHFLDSLAISPFISREGPLMDVGSGAGLPGLPLAILHSRLPVTLVEPRRKRANFLRAVVRATKLSQQVLVREERVEHLDAVVTGLFSTVVFRAVGQPEFFLRTARSFLAIDGRCLILHGPKGVTALDRIARVYKRLGFSEIDIKYYQIPPLGEERSVISVFT